MIRRLLARLEPYAAEVVLALCTGWCSKCLLEQPSNMLGGTFGGYYHLMLALDGHEATWATLSGVAAGLIAAGLASARCWRLVGVSVAARIAGMALAGFFLVVLGSSWLSANQDSLAAVPMGVLGLAGGLALLRGPAIPGHRR